MVTVIFCSVGLYSPQADTCDKARQATRGAFSPADGRLHRSRSGSHDTRSDSPVQPAVRRAHAHADGIRCTTKKNTTGGRRRRTARLGRDVRVLPWGWHLYRISKAGQPRERALLTAWCALISSNYSGIAADWG